MTTITEEKIIETAERLLSGGTNPTQVTVRAALGGGSFATIGPVLKAWKEGQKEDRALTEIQVPEAITERLEQLQGAVWQAAVDEAERRLTVEREALKAAQEAAAAEVSEQLESVAMLEAEADQLREKMSKLEAEGETQAVTVQSLEDELADAKEHAEKRIRAEHEQATKEASRADAAIERAERAEVLHRESLEQSRADLKSLKIEHKAELETLKKAEAERVKAANDLAQAQTSRAEKAEKEAGLRNAGEQACQSRLESAQCEAEQTQKRMAKLEERADRAVQEAAELRGELRAMKAATDKKTAQKKGS